MLIMLIISETQSFALTTAEVQKKLHWRTALFIKRSIHLIVFNLREINNMKPLVVIYNYWIY